MHRGMSTVTGTHYTAWAFVLDQNSAPCQMMITHEDNDNVGILAEQTMFPLGASIQRLHVGLNGRQYHVYFDITCHEQEDEEATYVFLCMQDGPKVISICAEDDFGSSHIGGLVEVSHTCKMMPTHHINLFISPRLHCHYPVKSSNDASYEKPLNTVTKPLAAARKKDFPCTTCRPRAITSIHPASNATGFLSLPVELQLENLSYCNVHELFQMGAATRKIAKLAAEYISHRMDLAIHHFFTDIESFQQMLQSCDAVVSGSSVLHILLPAKTTSWVPTDLNIYVSYVHYHYLTVLLKDHGYHMIREGKVNVSQYCFSLIRTITTFANGDLQIDIIISKKAGGLTPIFQFHSTTVMNFFGPDHFFCVYPALTLKHLAKVNPGPLYLGRFCHRTIDALLKYVGHGFRYTSCESRCLSKYSCKSVVQSHRWQVYVDRSPQFPLCLHNSSWLVSALWHFGHPVVIGRNGLWVRICIH